MTAPRVSIVMPSLNQGDFIGKALESISRQYRPGILEVILKDGISSDRTMEVVERYRHLDWLKLAVEPDEGQSDALVKGFQHARGSILCWLNSDDLLWPGAIDAVLSKFDAEPNTDVVYGEALFIDSQDNIVGRFPTSRPTLTNLFNRCVVSQPSVFFRRNAYASVGGLNRGRHFCMDYELWTRFAAAGMRFSRLKQILSCTRLHSNTKTATGGAGFIADICDMQTQIFGTISPVWQIYMLTRQKDLAWVTDKRMRFGAAAARVALTHPSSMLQLGRAVIERTYAEAAARIYSPPQTPCG